MPSESPYLSVAVPIYNEAENVRALVEELLGVLRGLGKPFEILAVDDASRDASAAELGRLAAVHAELRVLRHRVNAGQSAAYATAFHAARGAVVVTMDGDRQHDPRDIPRLLEALAPGVACVTGIRATRRDDGVKRLSSRLANGFRNAVTGAPVTDAGCTLRALRRECLGELPAFNGLHRWIPTLLQYQGWRVVELAIHHRPRTAGVSKYGIGNRLWRGLRDCFAMRWYRARALPGDRLLSEGAAHGTP
jgi:glycosyltransferase involved in cell wall biosynthesis